ncbi:MAG: DoxX family membrane protein [Anaerolineales bacterium]|nr:DoxX family membrane protein [Anaerolineales bacterium]
MKKLLVKSEPKTPLSWIALLRIMIGVMFLTTWLINLFNGFYTPEGLLGFFTEIFPQSENPLTWYAAFIGGVILPIRTVFAPFQLITEFLLGLGLLLGACTPFFSLAGIFFLVNTFLATFGHDWPWAYLMPIGILAITLFTRAGRSLGVDAQLLKRFGERGFLFW